MIKQKLKVIYSKLHNIRLRLFNRRIGKNVFIGKRACVKGKKYLTIRNNVRIGKDFEVSCFPEFGGEKYSCEIIFEENCYVGNRIKLLCNDKIVIHKNTLMASDILITTENHSMDIECGIPYGKQKLTHAPVEIGENCWIGEKVIILPGVKIGDWAVIAAGAVVNKSVPPYELWGGVPAVPLKRYNFETKSWEKVI